MSRKHIFRLGNRTEVTEAGNPLLRATSRERGVRRHSRRFSARGGGPSPLTRPCSEQISWWVHDDASPSYGQDRRARSLSGPRPAAGIQPGRFVSVRSKGGSA